MATINAYELLNNSIETIPFLVEPLFPKTGLVALVGSSDCGKSTFLRQLAMSIATKQDDFLGFKINALHNRVLYISTEDGYEAMSAIMKKQFSNHSTNSDTLQLQFCFDVEDAIEYLNNYFSKPENLLDCVIIDAFGDVFNGDSNMVSKVRPFLNLFKIISERNNCLIMFLHHTGKNAEKKEPNKSNILGSQGFEAKMRFILELRKDPQISNKRYLHFLKGNYLSEEYKSKVIGLEIDENLILKNIGECVIEFNSKILCDKLTDTIKDEIMEMNKAKIGIRRIAYEIGRKHQFSIGKTKVAELIKELSA